jgi:hypothetical protein
MVAWYNTTRTLRANANLEAKRRLQKRAALRAVLPLALSEINLYCSLTARALQNLWDECVDGALPKDAAKPILPDMRAETVQVFADFIEYSDDLDTTIVRWLLARLQVSRARIREIELVIETADQNAVILETNLEEYILDVAAIYAAAGSAFDYGREKSHTLPKEISWDHVRTALRNMKIWDDDMEGLYATITRRETDGLTP